MKRIISLILIALMLLPFVVSCDGVTQIDLEAEVEIDSGSDETDTESSGISDTAKPTETSEQLTLPNTGSSVKNTTSTSATLSSNTDEFGNPLFVSAIDPDAHDYDGFEIVVLMRNDARYFREWCKLEGDAADVETTLDEAIANRNAIVQEDLNLTPVYIRESKNEVEYNNLIINDVADGLHNYDVVANYAYFASDTLIRYADAYANLADEDLFPYFDFSLPCWNQSLINNTTLNGKLYLVAGDANLSMYDSTSVIWANLSLYEKYKKSNDPADIQQHAIDGKWTYNNLYSWALRTADTDDKTECGDFYGFSTGFHFFDTLPHAWDFELITEDGEGRHSFNIENNTRAEDALGIIRNIIATDGCAASHHQDSTKNVCKCGLGLVGHFADGDYAFISAQLYGSESQNLKIRNMSQKYTILPIPKYEAKQENYGTTSADIYNLVAVLNHFNAEHPTDGDAVSAYLQYLNEKSYTDVREFYFTRIVRSKFFGTDDSDGYVTKSVRLFNIIVGSIEHKIYTVYSHSINDIGWLWRDNILRGGTNSLATSFQENKLSGGQFVRTKAQYEQALAEFDAWIFDE